MKFIQTLLVLPLLLVSGDSAIAQVQRTMSFDANTSLMLQEFSAMLVQSEDVIQVEMIIGGHNDSSNLTDELQRGDIILMMNGERVNDVSGMRAIYNSISNEEEIKVGVRRGDERFIVRAIKGDFPETSGMRMVMNVDSNSDEPPVIVPELGLLLAMVDDNISIQALLEPLMPDELKAENIEGYTIVSINGETFDQAEAAQSYLASLEVGEEIELIVENDDAQKVISLKKQKARGAINLSIDN